MAQRTPISNSVTDPSTRFTDGPQSVQKDEIVPVLRGSNRRRWSWASQDVWRPLQGDTPAILVKPGMTITVDEEGLWIFAYSAETQYAQHNWVYALEARTKNDTPLFVLTLKAISRGTDDFDVLQSGRSSAIRRDSAHITKWRRIGISGWIVTT